MEQKKRWRAAGRICTGFGMTLIFCALALAGRHIWSEYRARESVEQLLSHMNQSITASAADRTAQEADADVQDTSDTPASPGVNESSGANGTSESTGMTGTTGTADSPGTNESPGATGANASTGMTGTTGANTSTGETDTAEQAREPFPDGLLGRLDIPSLELELPVWDSYTEDLLKQSVCRYGRNCAKPASLSSPVTTTRAISDL